jgi:outer membrane phospholipase A
MAALAPGAVLAAAARQAIVACCALVGAGVATAAETCAPGTIERCLAQCRERFPGADHRQQRYDCYDQAEAAGAVPAAPEASGVAEGFGERLPLDELWQAPQGNGFKPYRQNFVLATRTNFPNDGPTSPNPANVVPQGNALLQGEAKFQFSFKALMLAPQTLGERNGLWFGYTQQSYWQVFDSSNSRPFRESNYEPEVVFSHRFDGPAKWAGWRLPDRLNVGLVHQSNGQSDPRSRSWNRVYAQFGWSGDLSSANRYAVLVRPWWRFHESADSDNNPDITRYVGHGDIETLFWRGPYLLSLLSRERSLQADFSMPVPFAQGAEAARDSLQLHLQFFTGYGESLIDYNHRHTTYGIGLSVPYGLSR